MFVFEFWREAPDFVVVKIWSRLVKNTFFTQKYNDFSIIMFHKKNLKHLFIVFIFENNKTFKIPLYTTP